MNTSEQIPIMYESIPAVAELNRVPGFEPFKLLRRIVSPEEGKVALQLDLRFKKLWFRLAHPKGRIRLNPLRITEQMAIFEAQVYLDRLIGSAALLRAVRRKRHRAGSMSRRRSLRPWMKP